MNEGENVHINFRPVMMRIKRYFESTIMMLAVLGMAYMVMLIKDGDQPIFESILFSLSSQTGLFEVLGYRYGAVGIALAAVMFFALSMGLVSGRRVRSTRTQKLAKFIAIAYLLQGIFLTQTIENTTVYLIFTIAYINSVRLSLRNAGDDNSNEADDSDTVLQRSEDIGDSAQ